MIMQKERKNGESFEDYKKRLHNEKNTLRKYCKGHIFWNMHYPYVWRA